MTEPEYEYNVVKVRSIFAPRWYQLRFRFRMWRLRRDVEKRRKGVNPEVQAIIDRADREFERQYLFGDGDKD